MFYLRRIGLNLQNMRFFWCLLFGLSTFPASAGLIAVYPDTPRLGDTPGSVTGNTTESAPGFAGSSWQATGVKSNFYITPQDLFGHDVLVKDVASMSYWSNQFNSLGNSNWSLYIYTVNSGAGDASGWFRSRLFAVPGAGAPGWDQWTTSDLGFVDTVRGGGTATSDLLWSSITTGGVTLMNGSSWDYSNEKIKYFSVQTDSGATTFTGLVDGLTVNLQDGETAGVNFEAPEPGTWSLIAIGLVMAGLVRRGRSLGLFLLTAAAASAGTVAIDGVFNPAEWGAPVAHLTPYVDGIGLPQQSVDLYWWTDAQRVYGAVVGDAALPYAFPTANVYVYSSGTSLRPDGTAGTYGDGDDVIIESGDKWHFSLNGPIVWAGPDHLLPMAIAGTIHSGSDGLVSLAFDTSTLVTEFSIDRSLLGDYDKYRFGGQLYAYEFNTGSGDRQPGVLADSTPEPSAMVLMGIGVGLIAMARRYRR
uniref:Ice-binding protein C-terminal domain-containing protein n=1 Tax=Solibacter usitatus (strain Ellin6076) TaxID=234267 RepID=Q01PF6_SOLUE